MKKSIIALAILSTMSTTASAINAEEQYEIEFQACLDTRNTQVSHLTRWDEEERQQADSVFYSCLDVAREDRDTGLIAENDARVAAEKAEKDRIDSLPYYVAENSAMTCSSTYREGYSVSVIIEDNKISYQSFQFPGGEFYSSSQSSEMIKQYITPTKVDYETWMEFDGIKLSFFDGAPGNHYRAAYVHTEMDNGESGYMENFVSCTSEATHEEGVTKILAEGIINLATLGNQDISAEALTSNPENKGFQTWSANQLSVSAPSTPSAFALSIAAERVLGSYPRELTLDEKVILDDTIIAKLYEIDPNAEVPATITAPATEVEAEVEVEVEVEAEVAPADEGGNGSMGLLLMFLPLIRKIIK